MSDLVDDILAVSAPKSDPDAPLTPEEQAKVLEAWNRGETEISRIVKFAIGDEYDGRSKKGLLVKKFLAAQNCNFTTATLKISKMSKIVLSDADKELIGNNAAKNMTPMEMTWLIFKDRTLTPLSSEFRVVKAFFDTLDDKVKSAGNGDTDIQQYHPAFTEDQALARINKYAHEPIDKDTMTPHQKEWVRRLIRYMQTHRFVFEINNLLKNSERILFESSFVKYTYNKPDLEGEHVDSYITLCGTIITRYRMQIEESMLVQAQESAMAADGKIPMIIVDAINNVRTAISELEIRQKKIVDGLTTARSDRLKGLNGSNNTMLNLVEAFKYDKKRKQILELIEARRTLVKKDATRLKDMDEFAVEILGLKNEEFFI